jgi:hypothetical protein
MTESMNCPARTRETNRKYTETMFSDKKRLFLYRSGEFGSQHIDYTPNVLNKILSFIPAIMRPPTKFFSAAANRPIFLPIDDKSAAFSHAFPKGLGSKKSRLPFARSLAKSSHPKWGFVRITDPASRFFLIAPS